MKKEIESKGLASLFKKYDSLIFFDTETTGFDSNAGRTVELAAVCCEKPGGKFWVSRTMDQLIRLPEGMKMPEAASRVNHITDDMLANLGISETEALVEFLTMGSGRKLYIAYNAQFDVRFMDAMTERNRECINGSDFSCVDLLDPLTIARDRKDKPHKLSDMITWFGLQDSVSNTHRALDDVWALIAVTEALGRQNNNLSEYVNVFGYRKKYGVPVQRLKKVRYVEQD